MLTWLAVDSGRRSATSMSLVRNKAVVSCPVVLNSCRPDRSDDGADTAMRRAVIGEQRVLTCSTPPPSRSALFSFAAGAREIFLNRRVKVKN